MSNVQKRVVRAAERLLGNEALTDELKDPAARMLLEWGVENAKRIMESTAGMDDVAAEQATAPRLLANQDLMRLVNKWAAHLPEKDKEQTSAFLDKAWEKANTLYQIDAPSLNVYQREAFMRQLESIETPAQAVDLVRLFFTR
mgnify:CR=1 FL=1